MAIFYLKEIILGYISISNKGLIHRDLKPDNMVFDKKGELKIIDFGFSVLKT